MTYSDVGEETGFYNQRKRETERQKDRDRGRDKERDLDIVSTWSGHHEDFNSLKNIAQKQEEKSDRTWAYLR